MTLTDERRADIIKQAYEALDELIGWIDTNLIGCIEVEKRGEEARKALRDELARDLGVYL